MSKVEQIETEISRLDASDIWKLDEWLAEHTAKLWDEEMAHDARPGGPLDRLAKKAQKDFHDGRTTRLK